MQVGVQVNRSASVFSRARMATEVTATGYIRCSCPVWNTRTLSIGSVRHVMSHGNPMTR